MSDYNTVLIQLAEIIKQNPMLLAAFFAIVRNILGWFTSMLGAKKYESWDKMRFMETLLIYETFFILLQGVVGLPLQYVAIITIIVESLRALKKVIETNTKPNP